MKSEHVVGRAWGWFGLVPLLFFVLLASGCDQGERRLAPRSLTWAELRTVRHGVLVTPPGGDERPPYARERMVDGEQVRLRWA